MKPAGCFFLMFLFLGTNATWSQSTITFPKQGDTVWFANKEYYYYISEDTLFFDSQGFPVYGVSFKFPRYSVDNGLIAWDSNTVYRIQLFEFPDSGGIKYRLIPYYFNAREGTDTDTDSDTTTGQILLRKQYDTTLDDTLYWWLKHVRLKYYPYAPHQPTTNADQVWVMSRHSGILGFGLFHYTYGTDSLEFRYTVGDPKYFDDELAPAIKRIDPPPKGWMKE